jgi:type I restriction enzyme S subunit
MRKTNWQKYALGDILNAVSRPVDVEIDRSYRILGMRWYAQGLFEKEYLFGHEIKANKLFRVEEGDLVYNRLFAWKGSFGLVDSKTAGAFVSGEFPCFRVNSEIAEPKFLVWFLSREALWKDIERKSVGQTNISRLRLKVPVFLSFRIPLPPMDEQRRIANRLDAIAARVEQAQQLQINILDNITKLIVSLHVNMAKNREVTLRTYPKIPVSRMSAQASFTNASQFSDFLDQRVAMLRRLANHPNVLSTTHRRAGKLCSPGIEHSSCFGSFLRRRCLI